jgi:hypothetical protein
MGFRAASDETLKLILSYKIEGLMWQVWQTNLQEVTPLNHELFDNSMELTALIPLRFTIFSAVKMKLSIKKTNTKLNY